MSVIVIKGGKLIDGNGVPPVEDSVVVIEDGKFEAVGAGENVPIPDDAEVIDASGKVVMPGLMDAHETITNRGQMLSSTLNILLRWCHRRIPMAESIPPVIIQHFRSYLEQQMCSSSCPTHLLFLDHTFAHNLIHS